MTLLLADTFTNSLARLTGDEQKAVKTTAFDLQMNPASPGMQFHRLDKAKDRNFWSVRVSSDIRIIVHRTDASLLLCYVDHHDAAYAWAERRRLERHPVTGAAQLVEIRETVREIVVPQHVPPAPGTTAARTKTTRLFDGLSEDDLLSYGVPADWLNDVRAATEDSLLEIVSRLPGEAAEALLNLATGGVPVPAGSSSWSPHGISSRSSEGPVIAGEQLVPEPDPFVHPDARRRFRVMENVDDLRRALDAPWDAWTVFLHPVQQAVVSRRFNGPARVAGSAGTGKTVVALHRAYWLARQNPTARVLLATVSATLAAALQVKLDRLAGGDRAVLDRIDVRDITRVGIGLHEANVGPLVLASPDVVAELIDEAVDRVGADPRVGGDDGDRGPAGTDGRAATGGRPYDRAGTGARPYVFAEWRDVVDAWQITTWEAYRDVARLGRRTRLAEPQRARLWTIFEHVRAGLAARGLMTTADALGRATESLREGVAPPWQFVVVDESQDMGVAAIRLVAAIAGDRPNGLFFAGDLGQRIYQSPFSWKALGVDIRGRSQTLRVNYRTSHQIRRQADRLLGAEVADVDQNVEVRTGTVSVFNGPEPEVVIAESIEAEQRAVARWVMRRLNSGMLPHELAILVRTEAQLPRARDVAFDGQAVSVLSDDRPAPEGAMVVGTMHRAKGLEFRAVVVMACDDDVLPLQARIEGVTDEADLEDVYDTERHLLYVACTRARDWLLVTGVKPGSEFLGDFLEGRK